MSAAHKTNRTLNALGSASGSVLVLAAFIALWWAASTSGWVNRAFLPTPQATLQSLVQGLAGGDLAAYTWATLSRMFSGWVLASALGIALGALIGSSQRASEWIGPTLEFIRPLPASAVMPLAIALFGLSGGMVLAVVAFGAMWPVLLATLHGLATCTSSCARSRARWNSATWPSCSRSACPTPCPTSWPACGCR
ncbi:ABC transporter permease [Hydrogenophaga sp. UC242_53]|uniref:ABC transporter permease n=1 Tax=Hydrogenophaga sp. UC242_53 TaxID=3350170 RepID=UPI0036D39D09